MAGPSAPLAGFKKFAKARCAGFNRRHQCFVFPQEYSLHQRESRLAL
jgi:hypothetical protein